MRDEYIKAFQHEKTHDLYYIIINKENRQITSMPTTDLKYVINQIANAEKVEFVRTPKAVGILTEPIDSYPKALTRKANDSAKVQSLQDLEAIFKKNNKDSVNNELFDKVFSVAKDLKVEYSDEILGNRNILGQYNARNNKITLQDFSSETILHEMIHAVSSRAIDNPQVLKPIQKHAIRNLNRIYNRLKLDSKFKGEYALNSVKEMVVELSNPVFREKLKSRNLWQRIIDSIANLFGFRKDSSNYAKNKQKSISNYR